jgi:2-polyprenyl-6-methoxyphenol hydroxylase-like FAD-dependent oxidoreductase
MLDDLDVYEGLKSQGYSYEGISLVNSAGKSLGKVYSGSKKLWGYPALRISRSAIVEALLAKAKAQGIQVIYDKSLSSLAEVDDRVEMIFSDETKIQADRVIGADGIRSTVRKHLHPNAQPHYNGTTLFYGSVPADEIGKEVKSDILVPSMNVGLGGAFAIIPPDKEGHILGFFGTASLPLRSREAWINDPAGQHEFFEKTFGQGKWPAGIKALSNNVKTETFSPWP